MLTLIRNLQVPADRSDRGIIRRLFLVTPGGVFAAFENGDDPDKMPHGIYPLKMATMRRAGMRALWLPDTRLFGHPANRPDELKGCWAAGLYTYFGVEDSRTSFGEIFEMYGGFREGRQVPFQCMELEGGSYRNLVGTLSSWQVSRSRSIPISPTDQ